MRASRTNGIRDAPRRAPLSTVDGRSRKSQNSAALWPGAAAGSKRVDGRQDPRNKKKTMLVSPSS